MGCDLSPLQVLAEFPELPYVPFGQDSPSMSAGGDGKRRNVPTAKLSYKLNLATKKQEIRNFRQPLNLDTAKLR